ncbi:GLUG motif-containing protein [Sedimentisphaera salicampi]|uniref:GLUG domain-containing protein n=1 Tax=Sedimentisphaera salicampi TaxID=1941349 RepID=A0A1W6LN37_9BACT|nr:GLUG motif-containing protein [Sedimentisphaera salicampi]ARN57166.1 hypothetical protein STSP1_01562 [Sedimentisphaera salicampi]
MCILRVSVIAALAAAGIAFGFAAGDGTANNPYQISTPDHLEAVNDDLSAHYVLTNNIDLSGRTYDSAVIAPDTDSSNTGFDGTQFSGSFDGAGYKILNLTIDSSVYFLGLFSGIIDGGEIRNLGVEDAAITACDDAEYVGGLCGGNRGTITNCYATGSVSGGDNSHYLGGLCGINLEGTIENCYATGSVSGGDDSRYLGGLCGWNEGTIENCYAAGDVSGKDNSIVLGGLCGMNKGTITNCYAAGDVSGGDNSRGLGGLFGGNEEGAITNCYATGKVKAGNKAEYLGGLCGGNEEGAITNCYATGSVSGGNDSEGLGGLCGENQEGTITNCFWDKETSGMEESDGGTGLTAAQMKTQSTFTNAGWDFADSSAANEEDGIWLMDEKNYPKLNVIVEIDHKN